MAMPPILIVGAGLAGLRCGQIVSKQGCVVEQATTPGGTARTFLRDGFFFDCTGHWLHVRSQAVRAWMELMLPQGWQYIQRKAAIAWRGKRMPYPFQAHLFDLPVQEKAQCLLDFFAARKLGPPPTDCDLETYMRRWLGDGIAELFLLPYNKKLWTVPPSQLSSSWCGRFVPMPTAEEVVLGALQPQGAGRALGYNQGFWYPKHGGIGALAQAMVHHSQAQLLCQSPVERIDWRRKRARIAGHWCTYQVLASTMPLPTLIDCLIDVPEPVALAAKRLRATQVTYWNVALGRSNRADDPHWLYVPECTWPCYRIGLPSAVASHLAPAGCSSLVVETAHQPGTAGPMDHGEVVAALRQLHLLGRDEEPLWLEQQTIAPAYVIMDGDYGEARATVLAWLGQVGIASFGRYGAWIYDSMEGALLAGEQAAEQALVAWEQAKAGVPAGVQMA